MSAFSEEFQKELGKRLAQVISASIAGLLGVAGLVAPKDAHTARVILLSLASISLAALLVSLFFRYFQISWSQRVIDDRNKKAIEMFAKRVERRHDT